MFVVLVVVNVVTEVVVVWSPMLLVEYVANFVKLTIHFLPSLPIGRSTRAYAQSRFAMILVWSVLYVNMFMCANGACVCV